MEGDTTLSYGSLYSVDSVVCIKAGFDKMII